MDQWKLKPAADLELTPTQRWRAYQRESGLVSTVARACWWSLLKSSFKLLHRLEVHGREHIPRQPSFVLVANHASHLDALVLGAALPLRLRDQLFPLAAGDVFFEVPALAAFSAAVLNALPVWRKNCGAHAIKDLRQRLLAEPSIYILFPEGGRCRDGRMVPFKPGVGMMMAGTPVPAVPCHLSGTFEAFPPDARLPRFKKIRVHIGPPRVFADVPNKRDGWNEVAAVLERDVAALGGEGPCGSERVNRLGEVE
jgi:1-acyl-sn-glycerol-3-phosphate acyltransferase